MREFIPAICDNMLCGTVWFVPNFLGGAGVAFGNKISPCPQCGGFGSMPDGTYSDVSIEYFRQDQQIIVDQALEALRKLIQSNPTPDQIKEELKTNPVLQFLKRFDPKDIKELKELTVIVGMWAGYLTAIATGGWLIATNAFTSISVPSRAANILRVLSDALHQDRPDSPSASPNSNMRPQELPQTNQGPKTKPNP